jgi:ketosteroid isomerase-like protein
MNLFKKGIMGIAMLLAVVLGAAVAQNSNTPESEPRADTTVEMASLRDAWVKYWNARALGPLVEAYAPDAVLLPPNGQRVRGSEAIAKYWKQVMDPAAGTLSVQPISAGLSGDLAYESGRLTRTLPASGRAAGEITVDGKKGATRQVEGSYLVVLRRQPDGTWRIVEQAFTEALLKSMVEEKQPKAKPMRPTPQER